MRISRFALAALGLASAALAQTPTYFFTTVSSAWPGAARAGGIAVDAAGNVYIPLASANEVLKITPGGTWNTFASGLNGPAAVAVDGSGNLYVAESVGNDVRKITAGGVVSVFATAAALDAVSNDSGQAPFTDLSGIAVDGSGNVYVSSQANATIVVVSPEGICSLFAGAPWSHNANFVTTNGVPISQEYADGAAATALFNTPVGLAVDGSGNVYVADVGNGAIRKIAGQTVSTIAGGNSEVEIDGCDYLAVDSSGDVFFTGQTLQELTGGKVIDLAPVDPDIWPHFVNGVGAAATFDGPSGIALGVNGTNTAYSAIYVADDSALRKGILTTYTQQQLAAPAASNNAPVSAVNVGTAWPTLAVTAGSGYSAQWYFNGIPIAGATGLSYTPEGVVGALDAGNYSVVLTDPYGDAQGIGLGTLAVQENAWLINLSGRANVGTGKNALIAGFVSTGPGNKCILVRGDGPVLGKLGVSNPVTNPQIQIFNGSTAITNEITGWTATVGELFGPTGAVAFTSGSADDAVAETVGAGAYSAILSSANGGSGVAVLELYDADLASNSVLGTSLVGPPANRLINLSARANVGSGANVLIGGFVISGTTGKTLLLRAPGPVLGLPPFNISGAVSGTTLSLYDSSSLLIASTAGTGNAVSWGTSSLVTGSSAKVGFESASAAVFARVGAFDGDWQAGDSAAVVTLPPGEYTVIVGGAGNATGVGMVEIYELN